MLANETANQGANQTARPQLGSGVGSDALASANGGARVQSAGLARTGADIRPWITLAVSLIAAGVLILLESRRRRALR